MHLLARIAGFASAGLLLACGRPPPLQHPHGQAEVLLATDRGMGSLAFDGAHAYLSLANSATRPSAVLRTGQTVNRAAVWDALDLAYCALGPAAEGTPWRAPSLTRLAGTMYLYQSTITLHEPALCKLERGMVPHDASLRICRKTACEQLWMTDLQLHEGVLLSNGGGGQNVLALQGDGRHWRALSGNVIASACAHGAFRMVGTRLLVGTQCPAGVSALPAGAAPVALPALENRTIHFIAPAGADLFAGVTGGLLKSSDSGHSFRFVIHHAAGGASMPQIRHILALRGKTIVVAGEDTALGKPYLAVSPDGGERWTDLSAILPGFDGAGAAVTSLAQDRQGRLLATLNLQPQSQGRLLLLALGGVD